MKITKTILIILLLMSFVFMRSLVHAQEVPSVKSNTPPQGTNSASVDDLVAVAMRTHTKKAWLAALYREIENDPNIDEEMGSGVIVSPKYFIAVGIGGVVTVFAL